MGSKAGHFEKHSESCEKPNGGDCSCNPDRFPSQQTNSEEKYRDRETADKVMAELTHLREQLAACEDGTGMSHLREVYESKCALLQADEKAIAQLGEQLAAKEAQLTQARTDRVTLLREYCSCFVDSCGCESSEIARRLTAEEHQAIEGGERFADDIQTQRHYQEQLKAREEELSLLRADVANLSASWKAEEARRQKYREALVNITKCRSSQAIFRDPVELAESALKDD